MATQPDDELELTPDMELNPNDDHGPEDDTDPNVSDEDDGPAVVGFADEDEPAPDADNSTIRQMRQQLSEARKELAEARKTAAPAKIEVGPKPTLWDDEISGDEELYEKKLLEWHNQVAAADRETEQQAEENRRVNEKWQADLTDFAQKRAALQFEDAEESVETVAASFPRPWQFAAIVKAASDPALFLYALSKSEAKRDELAKFEDPIKMAAAVARMEGAVKVTKGRKAPEPDRPLRGSAQMPGGPDKQLEKLEKEATASGGDRTKIIAYKAAQAAKNRGK